jgi:hypothetical protein
MSYIINGKITTEAQPEDGYYVTQLHWSVPEPEDAETFVSAATKRFAEELRGTISRG